MCDTVAAVPGATFKDALLFGKNSDREYTEAQHLQLLAATEHPRGEKVRLTYETIDQVEHTSAILLSKPHWMWGAEIGANSNGLVIGNEALFSKVPASLANGIIGMDYLRLALERSCDVDEAIEVITTLLRRYGQSGNCGFRREFAYHNSYIIADSRGAKVLETVDRDWVVTPVLGCYAISNAMTIETSFEASSDTLRTRVGGAAQGAGAPFSFKQAFEDPERSVSGNYRHRRAMMLLGRKRGSLRETDIFTLLRDHEEGPVVEGRRPRICAHTRENPIGQTTASWVTTHRAGQCVHWVTGTAAPCTGIFKPLILEAGLPEHGPLPGAQEDSSSLWWRHESLRRLLDAADEDTRVAFSDARDQLELRFLQVMNTCEPVKNGPTLIAARGLTASCWSEALRFEEEWHARLSVSSVERR